MAVVIGNSTITGINVGGLPSNVIQTADIADNTIAAATVSHLWTNSKALSGYFYMTFDSVTYLFQWGWRGTGAITSGTLTFPITFANACVNVTFMEQLQNDTGGQGSPAAWSSDPTTSSINFSIASGRTGFSWLAVGF